MARTPLNPEAIPAELRAVPQWVNWKWVRRPGEPKPTKPPFHPSDVHASHSSASTWSPFDEVVRAYLRRESPFAGIGFVFADGDPFAGIDLDGCIDPETGEIAPWALEMVRRLDSYTEISPSGMGLKIFVRGTLPHGGKKRTGLGGDGRGAVEMYDRLRFFTLTGRRLPEAPPTVRDCERELRKLYEELFPPKPAPPPRAEGPRIPLDLDDEALLERALRADNGARFSALWHGDRSAYAGDDSRADLALCSMLAFWTGGDPIRMDGLFRRSGLMRPKWDERRGAQTYGERTVLRAISGTTEFYQPRREAHSKGRGEAVDPEACWKEIERKMDGAEDETPGELDEAVPEPDDGDDPKGRGRPSQATVLVQLALSAGITLFHTADEECFATVPVEGHAETWRLKSSGFRGWLQGRYLQREEKVPGGQAMQDALNNLAGLALLKGEELQVHTRLAEHGGAFYLCLFDEEWRIVQVDAEGWRLVEEAPVKFRRARGVLGLPAPVRGGSLEELREFVNVTDAEWPLLVSWLVAALRPTGPYPIVELHGEQGSAKSTTARVLRSLVDPNLSALRSEPKEARDIAIGAKNSWVLAFDNLSGLSPWLSDALCRIATGGGLSTRELYTNDEEALFEAQRPVILNGIGGAANRSDLLDRCLLLNLPAIPERKRRTEREFWAAFEAARPRILGALLDAVSAAIRNLPDVKLERLPRMADFAEWMVAAEPGLGWKPGTFLQAYERNRCEANSIALEASPIGELVLKLVRGQESGVWEGTAKELLLALAEVAGDGIKDRRDWPKNARALAVALRRVAPNLRAEGVEQEELPREGERRPLRLRNLAHAEIELQGDEHEEKGPLFRPVHDAKTGHDANPPIVSVPCDGAREEPDCPFGLPETDGEFASCSGLRHDEEPDAEEQRERLDAISRVLSLARALGWERVQLTRGHAGPGEAPWRYWVTGASLARLREAERALQEPPC